MAAPRFSMTVDQLLDGIREEAYIARRSVGGTRRAAFLRLDALVCTARDYLVLGMPEPRPTAPDSRSTE